MTSSSLAASLGASLGAGLAAFLVYLSTLAPTVTTNDAGRFQIAAPLLGTGHPTGYPTFILVGHLFTYLPFGDVAYRVNLVAAVFGGLAAALFVLVARELGAPSMPAAGGALLFAFSATFWSQATTAEVYTMNAAFILVVFLLMLRWRQGGDARLLVLAALLYGLSLGNNAGMVLLAPAYLVLLFSGWREGMLPIRRLVGAGAAFLLGVSVYLYVPIRGFAGAWHNYGDPVRTWGEVWRLVSGARFQRLMGTSPAELPESAGRFLVDLASQAAGSVGTAVGMLLVVGGAYGALAVLRRGYGTVGFSLLLGLACALSYALSYRIDDVAVYYVPVYLFLALFSAVAAGDLARRFSQSFARRRGASVLAAALLAAPLAVAGLLLAANYEGLDRSEDRLQRERSEAILARLPEGAVLYGKLPVVPMTYLTEVEGRRGDVTLRWLDGATQGQHLVPDLRSGRPVYFVSDPRYNEDYLENARSQARPVEERGGLIRLFPTESANARARPRRTKRRAQRFSAPCAGLASSGDDRCPVEASSRSRGASPSAPTRRRVIEAFGARSVPGKTSGPNLSRR